MLGYTSTDQGKMIEAIQNAYKYVSTSDDKEGLELAEDLLRGLWSEGYFDD